MKKRIVSVVLFLFCSIYCLDLPLAAAAYNTKDMVVEEKIICDATIGEDFDDDSIIVVINNEQSVKLKEYTKEDFSEIQVESIRHISCETMGSIEKQRTKNNELSRSISEKSVVITDEEYIDEKNFHQVYCVNLSKAGKENVLKCIKILEERDDVLLASPNYNYKITATPNDPGYTNGSQWAINKISLPSAWNITTGSSSVKVGIIDTGIQGNHPDLKNRVDRTLSRDFTGGNSPLTDTFGHGTHVAGIIGAQGNNGVGVTGVCWNIGLVSLKASVNGNLSLENISDAIHYATSNSIPILNCSAGIIENVEAISVQLAVYSGVFVCTAGNTGEDISDDVTMKFNNMIVVANSTPQDVLNTESCYSLEKVDLAAPGTDIYSTIIGSTYESNEGTSMAAPYVSGVAALLKSKYPTMNTRAIKHYILEGVDELPGLSNKVASGGRLNAYNALNGVKSYTVKFNANGGIGTMSDVSVPFNYYACLPSNRFEKESLPFAGWHAKRTSDNKWYYTNGSDSGWYLEGQQPSGYEKFLYEDESDICMDMSTNGDTVTMYAQWIDIEYTIVFNGNSGTGSMSNQTVQYGVPENLNTATFTKENFEFYYWYAKNSDGEVYCTTGTEFGWYLNDDRPYPYGRKIFADGVAVHEIEGLSDGDVITFYAYWEPTFGELGDADMDGEVTTRDATLIQKYDTGLATLTPTQILLADVNYDGEANVRDATMIRKYLAGLLDDFG